MKGITVGNATARVVTDSLYQGSRLTSIEVVFPRPFLAEFNTHCRFSRNSASSRAIPVWKRMLSVLENPYIPNSFGRNKAGMQAGEDLSSSDQAAVVRNWMFGRNMALIQAYAMMGGRREILATVKNPESASSAALMCDAVEKLIKDYKVKRRISSQDKGLHKQHTNRVLEPYSFHTVVVTSTHWRNFFGLRASLDAQPEARDFAHVMARVMMASSPRELSKGEWHLPYITEEDRTQESNILTLAWASAGKCARTSYLTQDGIRLLVEDVGIANDLKIKGHMSPLQHPARPREEDDPKGSSGNYSPVWTQLRKLVENEDDFTQLIDRDKLLVGCDGDREMRDFILSLPD